ncbi:hypothetical protein [Streptomyces sp. NBC_01180]|uniref:VG15 protein n=1 Tax=Streptomyces sp. NBC_01180 TaxID=2903763 RepID=UPI0038663DE6|nr:hypothetical protein OG708_09095 [Streptomyces sp. NBC_01180]
MQSTTGSVVQAVQAIWQDITPDRILSALSGESGKQILAAVIAGQLSVAQGAQSFVAGAMLAQGASNSAAATLIPGQLAGYAADGRSLATLLYLPALTTTTALNAGMSPEAASLRGLYQMAKYVSTTLADTARTATSVAMTATPSCVSYVRVVKLPACSRCIILAGRQYSYSTGFKRHPKCDCGMEPMSDSAWKAADSPTSLYDAMSPEERRKRFGAAGAEALDNGADLSQVVNARRGMTTVKAYGRTVRATNEGTTRRGIGAKAMDVGYSKHAGSKYARTRAPRLLPEEILSQSSDREHQIRLLRRYGYIT